MNKNKRKILIEFYATRILLYLVFVAIVTTYAIFANKILPFGIILVAYTLVRWCYPTTWHHHKSLNCLVYSIIFFVILSTLSLPISMSILSGVMLGLIFTYYMYKLQVLIDKAEAKAQNEITIFDLTKDQLYKLLDISMLSESEKDAVEYRVIKKLKGKFWYRACGYSKRNVQYLYKHAVEKLNKLLKDNKDKL